MSWVNPDAPRFLGRPLCAHTLMFSEIPVEVKFSVMDMVDGRDPLFDVLREIESLKLRRGSR